MEPALDVDPAKGGTLEIPSMSEFDRVAGNVIALVAAALLAVLAIALPYPGHEVGYIVSGACVWWAFYLVSLPKIKVALDPSGIEFADMTWGAFFRFPRRRVAWRDLIEVRSRMVVMRRDRYVQTRVRVKISDMPLTTRGFSVTSKDPGYYEFLKMLRDHGEGPGTETEPFEERAATMEIFSSKQWLVVYLLAILVGAVLSWFTYR